MHRSTSDQPAPLAAADSPLLPEWLPLLRLPEESLVSYSARSIGSDSTSYAVRTCTRCGSQERAGSQRTGPSNLDRSSRMGKWLKDCQQQLEV